jgi:hypothetical protein
MKRKEKCLRWMERECLEKGVLEFFKEKGKGLERYGEGVRGVEGEI